jgi:molybdopterin molybdotransferase
MLSFEEARHLLLATVVPVLGDERISITQALGRVLAQPVVARQDVPAFAYSSMDGYALRWSDLPESGPLELPVAGESSAGSLPTTLPAKSAFRIFTGAPLPSGADTVVMQEDCTLQTAETTRVFLQTKPKLGSFIRHQGEDLRLGQEAIAPGNRLTPAQLGLAASLDYPHLYVVRKPKVVIVCSGNELRAPGDPALPGTIAESNAVALSAWATQVGADVSISPFARDNMDSCRQAIRAALCTSDLVLTTGGVSVGDHDLIRPALEAEQVKLTFYKVAMKPGKPLVFGTHGNSYVMGLPGNPSSAMVTFALFGIPLLRLLSRERQAVPVQIQARLSKSVRHGLGRKEFIRGRMEFQGTEWVAIPHDNQASGASTAMAWANALLILPENVEQLAQGEMIAGWRLADL